MSTPWGQARSTGSEERLPVVARGFQAVGLDQHGLSMKFQSNRVSSKCPPPAKRWPVGFLDIRVSSKDEAVVMMTSDPAPTPAPTRAKRGSVTVADVPHMATRYDPANELPPSKVAAKSENACRWVCAAGPDHRYEAKPISVHTSARGACPFCSGRRASVTNRLDVLYPEVAAEWDTEANDRPAAAVVATTEARAWWRCSTCGHLSRAGSVGGFHSTEG